MEECRFCLLEGDQNDLNDPLIAPCNCRGSGAFVHKSCLRRWRQTDIRDDQDFRCPVCLGEYRADMVNIYVREHLPDLNGDHTLRFLNNPILVLVLLNYLFMFYSAIIPQPYTKYVYRTCPVFRFTNITSFICDERVRIVYDSFYITFFFKAIHTLLSAVYFSYYLAMVANVNDWWRYARHAGHEAWIPFFHVVLIRTMDDTHILGGAINHFILPQYFRGHLRILRRMNAEF